MKVFWISGSCGHPEGKIFRFVRLVEKIFRLLVILEYILPHTVLLILFGIADLTRLQLPKCNNHLVSFIKVDGLSVSYIVDIFDIMKSRTML